MIIILKYCFMMPNLLLSDSLTLSLSLSRKVGRTTVSFASCLRSAIVYVRSATTRCLSRICRTWEPYQVRVIPSHYSQLSSQQYIIIQFLQKVFHVAFLQVVQLLHIQPMHITQQSPCTGNISQSLASVFQAPMLPNRMISDVSNISRSVKDVKRKKNNT